MEYPKILKSREIIKLSIMKKHTFFLLLSFVLLTANIFAKEKEPNLNDALMQQDVAKMKELIANGANVNEQFSGNPLINWAITNGNCEIIKLLVDNGADINDQRSTIRNFQSIFSLKEPEERLAKNIKTNATILKRCKGDTIKASQWLTHEDITRFSTVAEVFNLLVELGCDINDYDRAGEVTVLLMAVRRKDMPMLKLALDSKKCDLELRYHQWAEKQVGFAKSIHTANFADKAGKMTAKEWAQVPKFKTPLLHAINKGEVEIVKMLVDAGAELSNGMKKESGGNGVYEWWLEGPLDLAIHEKNQELIDYLKSKGAKRLNDK